MNKKPKVIYICGKCVNEMSTDAKAIPSRAEKQTCGLCGKRRYCGRYEVGGAK